nr:ATP-dependent Clp protease proteolytic subunit-related protein 1, chloroplastic [Ipomoea batatas]
MRIIIIIPIRLRYMKDPASHQEYSYLLKHKESTVASCEARTHSLPCSSVNRVTKIFRITYLLKSIMVLIKRTNHNLVGKSEAQMWQEREESNNNLRSSKKRCERRMSLQKFIIHLICYSMLGKNFWIPRTGKLSPGLYLTVKSMYYGGARGYGGRPRSAPPDLPSLLLDARIVYLGMPIVPAVSELLVAQFLWLDYDNPTKPIYLYINSHGTQNEKKELVGSETDAYAIADAMRLSKPDVCTVNVGKAYGQAGMLLSLGKKGFRALQASASTKLYLPDVYKSSGPVTEMWIKAKELEANKDYYLELLSKGIGKPKEEIERDIQRPAYFTVQEAIDYGIADKIIDPKDSIFEKRDYEGMLAQSRAMRRAAGSGAQAAAGSG